MFLSAAEAAKKMGLHSSRVRVLAKQGRLPGAVKIGHYWAIPEEAAAGFVPGPPGQPRKRQEKEQ